MLNFPNYHKDGQVSDRYLKKCNFEKVEFEVKVIDLGFSK